MVTHGDVAFRYKGIYYIFYNHSDSYCEALGIEVVNDVNNIVANNYITYYKKKLLLIQLSNEMTDGDRYFSSIYNSIVGYKNCSYYTSNYQTSNEYVYIIDFDENDFIINKYDNRYVFDLFDIPDNWMKIVKTNDEYIYENRDQIKEKRKNDEIKERIIELEKELNELKLKLV